MHQYIIGHVFYKTRNSKFRILYHKVPVLAAKNYALYILTFIVRMHYQAYIWKNGESTYLMHQHTDGMLTIFSHYFKNYWLIKHSMHIAKWVQYVICRSLQRYIVTTVITVHIRKWLSSTKCRFISIAIRTQSNF